MIDDSERYAALLLRVSEAISIEEGATEDEVIAHLEALVERHDNALLVAESRGGRITKLQATLRGIRRRMDSDVDEALDEDRDLERAEPSL